jgi:CelD/BcsL family acetyltransferase involved in cellulose biosynthesis
MQVRVVRDQAQFDKLAACWDELVKTGYQSLPFYSWTWYSTWWKHFGQGSDLLVLVAEECPDRVEGITPLLRARTRLRGLPVREVRFLDNSIGPRNAVLLRPDDVGLRALRGMVQCFVDHRAEWDLATLPNIDAEAPYLGELSLQAQRSGLRVVEVPARQSPCIRIDGDFSTYWASNFDSKQRYNIRRRLRMLSERGQYRVVDYTAPSDMETALRLAFQVSARSWKGRIGTHMNGSHEREAFYREITRSLAERRQVRIWLAMLNDRPIAVKYHLVSEKTVHSVVSDFDESFRDISPGNVLLYHVLEKLRSEGTLRYEFCGNTYDYEKPWATGVKPHVTLQLFNHNWYSRFIFVTKTRILPLLSRMRHPFRRNGAPAGAPDPATKSNVPAASPGVAGADPPAEEGGAVDETTALRRQNHAGTT